MDTTITPQQVHIKNFSQNFGDPDWMTESKLKISIHPFGGNK